MQTTAIGTVANSLPENEVILLTLLISKGYILFAELPNKSIYLVHILMGRFGKSATLLQLFYLYLCSSIEESE